MCRDVWSSAVQSVGVLLSADRSAAGRRSNDELHALLVRHDVRLFGL
ncbi:hypothetical protein [Kribbella sp. CA-294648]